MDGEKPTNKALQFAWQGTKTLADSKQELDRKKIVVVGFGKTGNNIVTELTKMGAKGTHTIIIDNNSLLFSKSRANQKILLDRKYNDDNDLWKLMKKSLVDRNIMFLSAGLEDGAKSDITLKIAELGKKLGIITLAVLVKPLIEEKPASKIPTKLLQTCDTIAVIDTSKLKELRPEMPCDKISEVADKVLAKMIKNIAETISTPCLKNLDFTEFRTIVEHGGNALIGIGESEAPSRAIEAAIQSLENPLFAVDHTSATKALVHITGDSHMTLEEADRVNNAVTDLLKDNIQVIWGANADPELDRKIRVTLVMTGVNSLGTQSGFNAIAPELFNLEPNSEPEKTLSMDLGLYQLENFET